MSSPSAPPFALAIGVTGHRAEALPSWLIGGINERIGAALQILEQEALAIRSAQADVFADGRPRFTLVSPLASGADQMAASLALQREWDLQAVLPLHRDDCARAEPNGGEELGRLLAASRCVLELPGDPEDPVEAYVLAGRATVAHCDLLIAVWDGLPARGRGGTAETVALAILRGTPVLHIPIDPAEPETLLWSAFDPVVITTPGDRACGRAASSENVRAVLEALLAPPPAEIERRFLQRFLTEHDRGVRWRIEYPLLMMLAGAKPISKRDLSAKPEVLAIRDEWQTFKTECVGCHGVEAPLDFLEDAYGWSDRLATHFAQIYRSSHVLNFLLAALGAWLGLSGLVLDANPLAMAVAEFVVVLIVIINTLTGSRRCWHQRWLDYRQLAERLRPMRSLKLLGIAAPDPPGSAAEPVARRWIDWYSAAVWRSIGCASGRMRAEEVGRIAAAMADRELGPQIAYNYRNAEQVERLDGRLERVALALFVATLIVNVGVMLGLEFTPGEIGALGNWTTVLSAGLPALGTAIFGIRVQGDYGAVGARSRSTAGLLDRIARDLRQTTDLSRTADLTEQAARVMLADLGEWRLVNELHELSLG